jgi:hypothetical protein
MMFKHAIAALTVFASAHAAKFAISDEQFNFFPVRGWLHTPASSTADVVILMHGTIESTGVTPMDAAQNFLSLATDATKLNMGHFILFSCAYPQDSIPGWSQEQANATYPGLDLSTLFLGDNIVYAEAALEWTLATDGLAAYLSRQTGVVPKPTGKVSMFGHSQGGYLVHRLNTMVSITGRVVSNAPGPIDLLPVCAASESSINKQKQCEKLRTAFGSTDANPAAYNSRSLKSFMTGLKAPIFYTQGLDDTDWQVGIMQTITQPSIQACTGCNSALFKYYCSVGHTTFADSQCQADIRNFLDLDTYVPSSGVTFAAV